MKKIDLRICSLILTTCLMAFGYQAGAQNAKIQWIHNSAAVALDTIDIYADGVKIADDLLYTHATGLLLGIAGTWTININSASSSDSGDQVISRHTLDIGANSNNIIMITGVDDPLNYAVNPSGRDLNIRLIHRKGIVHSTTSSTTTSFGFYNGTTDGNGYNLVTRPTSTVINISKLKYADTTGNLQTNSTEIFLDIKDTLGTTVLNSYILPLNLYGKKSLAIFTSGFTTPASNQNGAGFGVFITDTSGGPAVALKEASRIQFINNAPDVILDTVDIWLNNTKLFNKLGFRKGTTTGTILSGTYDITLTKKNSPDTIGSNVVYQLKNYVITGGKNYLAIINGVVDTNNYKTNPEGLDRSLKITLHNNYAESHANASQTSLFFAHGIPDAPAFGISRNPAAPIVVFNAASYGASPVSANFTASSSPQVILQTINGEVIQAYRMALAGQGGKVGVILTSGFMDTVGNVTGSKVYQYLLVMADGSSSTLNRLESKLQVVHASADPAVKSFTLFMNGKLLKDTMNFRTAIPAQTLISYKPYRLHFTSLGSADTTTSFYAINILPDSGKFYYAITSGLTNTSGFAVNPDGVDRTFKVILNPNGREKAVLNTKNIDLLYLHNMTDAPSTTIRGDGQILFLSKFNPFQGFHGHNAHSAFDEIRFNVLNANTDTILFTGEGNFALRKGDAGLVASTGFIFPANNNNGDTAMLFVFWPDGKSDTLPSPFTGMNSAAFDESSIQLFPNPAGQQMNIILNARNQGELNYRVTDLVGKTILSTSIQSVKGSNTININTATLPTGLYLITLQMVDQVYTTKFAVTR
ncbi:MAG: DUF4397 domain-containing protein [Bacteroidia bacterium]